MRQNRVREALGRIYDQQPPYFREYLRRFQEDPTSRVFAPLAEAFRRLGRVDEAIEICREGLEHHPDFHGGRVALAKCLMDRNRFSEAQEELQKVVQIVPENLLAQRLLGDCYESLGDKSNALHSFKMALLISPSDVTLAQKVHSLEKGLMASPSVPAQAAEKEELWNPSETTPAETPGADLWADSQTGDSEGDSAEKSGFSIDKELQASTEIPDPFVLDEEGSGIFQVEVHQNEAPAPVKDHAFPAAPPEAPPAPPENEAENDFMFGAEAGEMEEGEGDFTFGGTDETQLMELDEVSVITQLPETSGESVDALLADEGPDAEDGYRVQHVSSIFGAAKSSEREITTATLGDLYFKQEQFEKALDIFEKLAEKSPSQELTRKITACRAKLGVNNEALAKKRQVAKLQKILARVRQS